MTIQKDSQDKLTFYGGLVGAMAPLFLFLTGVIWLGLSGAPDEKGFWPVLMAALALGLILARDRARYSETLITGMSRPIVMVMIMAWLLAGILAKLMNASGFVLALVWLAESAGLQGGLFCAAAFLICCAVSTSTGTSLGTILLCGPLLYPAGDALAASPFILMGAIIGGATFGDNISPVSDTTIASAMSQDAEMGAVVRSRLAYALPAAVFALIAYTLFGGAEKESTSLVLEGGPKALVMLIAPALVIVMMLKRRHLLEGLMAGCLTAIILSVGMGLIEPAQLLYINKDAFVAQGLIWDGMNSGIGISIFTILVMGLAAGVEATGILDRITSGEEASSIRWAETRIVMTVSAAVLLTTHAVVAILSSGPVAKKLGAQHQLSPSRRANLLDVTVSTWPFLLPYFIPTILAASVTGTGAARLSPLEIGLANFHSWGLMVMIIIALATGYGRKS